MLNQFSYDNLSFNGPIVYIKANTRINPNFLDRFY